MNFFVTSRTESTQESQAPLALLALLILTLEKRASAPFFLRNPPSYDRKCSRQDRRLEIIVARISHASMKLYQPRPQLIHWCQILLR